MGAVDIDAMDLKELKAHRETVEALIKQREVEYRERAKEAARAAAEALGFKVEDLFGFQPNTQASPAKEVRQKVAPKYRNPKNSEETWTGRGRPPLWLKNLLEAGHDKDEYLIEN